jgi:hypothetical protein
MRWAYLILLSNQVFFPVFFACSAAYTFCLEQVASIAEDLGLDLGSFRSADSALAVLCAVSQQRERKLDPKYAAAACRARALARHVLDELLFFYSIMIEHYIVLC